MPLPIDGGGMTGPPTPPPNMPTLSAMTTKGGPAGADGPGSVPPSKGEALLRKIKQIEDGLAALAAAAPDQSEALDDIKSRLRDVMTAIVTGGSSAASSATSPLRGEGGGGMGNDVPYPR